MDGTQRTGFTAELARRRAEAGLSLADVATAAHVARGYVHHIENGHRWPSRAVAQALDAAVGASGELLRLWTAGDAGRRTADTGRTVATAHSQPPEEPHGALLSAADESADFLVWAEASNTGELTVEQMHADVRRIAGCYLTMPTLPLFARARATRDHAFALLAGRQRPRQTRELYAAAGWALTLLAWMSTDLGRPDAADMHARAAWLCADNADHNGLRAWVRATQHTAAFWEHHYLDAARYAEDGLRYAAPGTASTLLASAHAVDLANAGYVEDARAALTRARIAADSAEQTGDELSGPFTCSVDRARGFWSDVYLTLGQPAEALTDADAAVAASERSPVGRRNHGSERMARLQQVRAHVALGQLDGAVETLAPVLEDTAPEHRVQPLVQRLGDVFTLSLPGGRHGEPALVTMREAITDFRRHAVVAGPPT